MRNKFFKLNWKVLVLTLIIFVILSFVPMLLVNIQVICKFGPCPPVMSFFPLYTIIQGSSYISFTILTYLTIFIQLFLSYLISCLIFYRRK